MKLIRRLHNIKKLNKEYSIIDATKFNQLKVVDFLFHNGYSTEIENLLAYKQACREENIDIIKFFLDKRSFKTKCINNDKIKSEIEELLRLKEWELT